MAEKHINRLIPLLGLLMLAAGCAAGPEALVYPADLGVIEREQWGWKPGDGKDRPHEIERITIHHGGLDFADDRDPVEHVQALQSWGRAEKGWIDIPYHFMIDRQGRIYETRPIHLAGDTNTEYDPSGHALVEVMGNYQNQALGERQFEALAGITAFLARTYEVPIGNIGGHRDYADTDCPGDDIYRHLKSGALQRRVREILEAEDHE